MAYKNPSVRHLHLFLNDLNYKTIKFQLADAICPVTSCVQAMHSVVPVDATEKKKFIIHSPPIKKDLEKNKQTTDTAEVSPITNNLQVVSDSLLLHKW